MKRLAVTLRAAAVTNISEEKREQPEQQGIQSLPSDGTAT
jgi:hypothetical protein